ncbi:unnamed protein product, partial [Prorocentrum cordatum]
MHARNGAFSRRRGCDNWPSNVRIVKNGGKCAKCWSPADLHSPPPKSARRTQGARQPRQSMFKGATWHDQNRPSPEDRDPTSLAAPPASRPALKEEPSILRRRLESKCEQTRDDARHLARALDPKYQATQKTTRSSVQAKNAATEEPKWRHAAAAKKPAEHGIVQAPQPVYTSDGNRIVFAVHDALFSGLANFDGESSSRRSSRTSGSRLKWLRSFKPQSKRRRSKRKKIGSPPRTKAGVDQEGSAAVGAGSAGDGQAAAQPPPNERPHADAPGSDDANYEELRHAADLQRKAALEEAEAK